jgi:hypothetical protein
MQQRISVPWRNYVNSDSNADVRIDYEVVEAWDNYDG